MIGGIEAPLRHKDTGLELTSTGKKWLEKKGWDPVLGARPLRRTIQREIEDSLSERILFNDLKAGEIVVIDCDGDPDKPETSNLTFRGADKPAQVPETVPADLGRPATAASGEAA